MRFESKNEGAIQGDKTCTCTGGVQDKNVLVGIWFAHFDRQGDGGMWDEKWNSHLLWMLLGEQLSPGRVGINILGGTGWWDKAKNIGGLWD